MRLTQLDGKLPNLALMKLAHYHRAQGDSVHFARTPSPTLFEPQYDLAYASAIFAWTRPVVDRFRQAFPDGVVGGTGTDTMDTVESVIGAEEYEHYDYDLYPDYKYSVGFTQRGCRLKCGFCVVPKKEGKPKSVNTIMDIWRPGTPKAVVLLDNDFFGQPEDEWRARIEELRAGNFAVSFNQGINIRMVTEEAAKAIASVRYSDDDFKRRRLYTAWDNLGDEQRFFAGLQLLNDAGIPSKHVMVYMLIGYDRRETMEKILYRFNLLKDAGCMPFPMVYERENKPELRKFARWAIRRYYQVVPWEEFREGKSHGKAKGGNDE